MEVTVTLNPKHESAAVTAFLEYIKNSGHSDIKLIVGPEDRVNHEQPGDLENLKLSKYQIHLVNKIIFVDADGEQKQLY